MRYLRRLVVAGCVSILSACGGGEQSGTGGASMSAGADGGGATSTGGKTTGGSGGLSLGGASGGAGGNSGGSGALDMSRVLTAHKIKRRFSLGDSDNNVCIARAQGGVLCTIAAVGKVLLDQQVDLVTMSGLGYCAILDNKSVKCAFATSDSAAAKAFGASVTTAAYLMKDGEGLVAIDDAGAVRIGNGATELSAKVAPGSILGGPDFDACALAPDGFVTCFLLTPGNTFDKTQFDFANTKYADIAQSLSLFAGINLQGKLRVRHKLEDVDKVYAADTFVQVAAYSDYWCMLTNTGTLRCDGYAINQGPPGIANVPSGEFLAVDVNENFACAVRPTGELVCWGGNPPTVTDKVRIE